MKENGEDAARKVRSGLDDAKVGACNDCGVWKFAADLEIDHVVPIIDGGLDSYRNIQVLCCQCHRQKTVRENKERIG